jgi:succinate dehydrogenase / fumarate reductase membrane anchor subunit
VWHWRSLCSAWWLWLVSASLGADAYAAMLPLLMSLPGKLLLALAVAALIYHFCNGLRHLAWDMGWGFERADARRSAALVVAATLIAAAMCIYFIFRPQRGRRMSLRAPLARALHHGTARDGVGHWLVQRVTAARSRRWRSGCWSRCCRCRSPDYASVTRWIGAGLHPVLLALTVLIAAWHAWLGVQVVIEDYVHGFLPRPIALLARCSCTCCWRPAACTRCCALRCASGA